MRRHVGSWLTLLVRHAAVCLHEVFAKENFVDHTLTDQSSILRFIEDNWRLPRIADSFDAIAGPITNMLDFSGDAEPGDRALLLDPSTGQPIDGVGDGGRNGDGRADGSGQPSA